MRKGVYAFLKENEDGTLNINIQYSDEESLASIDRMHNKSMSENLTRHMRKYAELNHKARLTGDRKPLLDGICNIASTEEFIRLVGMLAKSCKSSNYRLYVFQDGKIIYTTDKEVSLTKDDNKEVDFGVLNKAAMESLVRSYR